MKDKYAREQIKRLDAEITKMLERALMQSNVIVDLAELVQKLVSEDAK